METQSNISSYLVRPRLTNQWRGFWVSWRIRYRLLRQSHPRLARRSLAGLAIWAVLNGLTQYLLSTTPITANSTARAGAAGTTSLPNATLTAAQTASPLRSSTSVTAAHTLPGGPTGQLLPPGALAPYGTYFNTYAKGQCTWYVASRRPIPSNWSNAKSWYYHATASGWQVGTAPAVGAIAWTAAGPYGHVALVENISTDHTQVYISEMNYAGVGVVSHRWVAATAFRYIY